MFRKHKKCNQSVMTYVLEALVGFLGQFLRHQNPFLINYQHTIKPKYRNAYFCSEEGNKGTETCQNRFFFP